MSQDPMFQPPNPADLRRRPPATPACARVRGMLRDYVDGDLGPGKAGIVEDHVSSCRACSVELSRAEHETLRLRQAFAEQGAEERPLRADFASRVVEQLVLTEGMSMTELGTELGPSELVDGRDEMRGDGADGSTFDDGNPDDGNPDDGEGSFLRLGPVGMLVAGAAVLALLVASVQLFGTPDVAPKSDARLVVLSADDTFDAFRRRLMAGDSLGENQILWVGRGGTALIDWHDASERAQPAATLEVIDGELRLSDGSPLLDHGKLLIETNRGVSIPMADGSVVDLGIGEYSITAIPSDMIEDAAHEPLGAVELPGELRIEVETRDGQPAQIVRADAPPAIVAIGRTGVCSGSGSVDVSSGPVADLGGTAPRVPVTPPVQGAQGVLAGYVFGPGGQPSHNTEVLLAYASQSQLVQSMEISQQDGRFLIANGERCESDFAIVMALPASQLGMAFVPPHPVALQYHNEFAYLKEHVVVQHTMALQGIVRDNVGQLRVGAKVLPCIIDEWFGTVMMLPSHATTTNGNAVFAIDELPAKLPRHQHLALMIWQSSLEPTIVPVPERGEATATTQVLPITVQQVRSIQMHELPVSATLTVLEEVPGMPLSAAASVHEVTSDAQGRVLGTQVGRGRLWLLSGSALFPRVQPLVLDQLNGLPRYRPDGPPVDIRRRFRVLHNLDGTNVRVANHYRYENIEVQPVENVVSSQALRVTDGFNRTLEGCEVFAVSQSITRSLPDARFLGLTNAAGVLSLGRVKAHEDVFVLGPAGEVAWIARPGNLGATVSLVLKEPGRVLVDEQLRPDSADPVRRRALVFRRDANEVLSGMRPVAVRFAGDDNDWEVGGIPPGHYWVELDQQVFEVEVPSKGFVRLQPD
ncbi:MAG: anti-sigma factor family protein [Planctomycetota bacterium]